MFPVRAALVAVVLVFAGVAAPVHAQGTSFEHRVYLDLDSNAGTGCTVVTPAGTVSGVEVRLTATVSGQPPQVSAVTRESCTGAVFGAPVAQPAGYPVGLNLGVGGSDVVEFSTALAGLGSGGPARLIFASGSATGADLVAAGGFGLPAAQTAPQVIPVGGLLAVLLLAAGVFWLARRHPALGSSMAVMLLLGAGVAWAAGFITDGQVGDWAGVAPLATDPAGDTTSGESPIDVVAVFAATEAGRLFVRVDVNDAQPPTNLPPTVDDAAFSIAENSANGTTVGSVIASDPDAGQALSYAITAGNVSGAFGIDAAGAISVANSAALDFETTPSFSLTVSVTDNGSPQLSDTATVTISLSDANDPPTASDVSFSLPENSADATVVGSVVASDPDASAPDNTLGFAISAGNTGGAFAIDAGTGQISVANTTQLDFETSPAFSLTVTVTDGGALSTTATVSIGLTDVNERPVFADASRNVVENSPAGTAIGAALAATDPDASAPNNALTYAISAGNTGNAFQIDAGGQLRVQTPAAVTLGNSPFTLTVVATDGGGLDDSAAVTVTVTDINDAPSFAAGPDQTVLEDAGAQSVASWAGAIDDGDPAVVQALTFNVTGNTNPGLFAAGPAVSATGQLSYTPAANANGSALITIELQDDGGTAMGGVDTSAPQSFTISVTPVNDAPSFVAGADQAVLENAGAQTVDPWASAISAGPADESGQTLAFSVTGNTNPALFSAGPAVSPSGVLSFTPAPGASGAATISLVLGDNGGTSNGGVDTSASQDFTISVTAVNSAPVFTVGADQTVNEDAGAQTVSGWATGIDDGDPGVTQTLTFNITGNTNPGLFAVAPAVSPTGELTYTPAADASGTASITLTLSDDGGTANGGVDTSAAQGFNITVNAVNDPPTATTKSHTTHSAIELEIVAASHTGELLEGAADVDDAAGDLTAVLVAGSELPAGAVVTITDASTGSFRYDPPGGYSGAGSFQFRICDDGAPVAPQQCSAATTVSLTITGPELWFVDDSAAAGGDGGLNDPLNSLADLPAGRGTGDRIYVLSGNYASGISLNQDEHLIGQGHSGSSSSLLGVVAVANGTLDATPAAGAAPSIGGTVTLGGNNAVLRGVAINSGASTGLAAGAVSGVSVSESSVNAASATAVNLNGTSGTLDLASTSSGGGSSGIVLNNLTGSFGFGMGALSGHSGVSFLGTGSLGTTSYSGNLTRTAAGNLVEISGAATGDVTLSGNLSCSGSCAGIDVLNRSGGTITFSGVSKVLNTGANTAVNLTGNAGASVGFSGGGLDIDTSSGIGLNASGGGTLTVTGGGNSVASTAATAISIVNTTLGAGGAVFESVSSSNATNGIVLNTAGSGGFTVTGTPGIDGSGGTISNINQRGVSVIATDLVSLSNLSLSNANQVDGGGSGTCDNLGNNGGCNAAIHLDDVAGATLHNVDISGTVAQYAINGRDVVNFVLRSSITTNCGNGVNEACLRLVNSTGTSEISNTDMAFASDRIAQIENTSGSLSLTVSNSTFRDTQSSGNGADGLEILARGTSSLTVDVVNSQFLRNRTHGLQVQVADNASVGIDVTGSRFDRGTGSGLGIDLDASGSGSLTYNVIGNPLISASGGHAFNSFATGNAVVRGRVNNNPDIQVGGSGTSGTGIRLNANESADMIVEVSGNTVSNIGFDIGIDVQARDLLGAACGTLCSAGRLDAVIDNNSVTLVDAFGLYDIRTQAESSNTTCAQVINNTTSGAGTVAYRARTSAADSTLLLQGFSVDATTTWNGNGNTPAGSVSSSHNGTLAGATCRTVSHPLP
ncbi:beta strand repeat-containing protein [Pseudomarimonas salicorniae]|uniref:Cadherin domain-containing protein n=1 Tax=Pseudomarimonas salicorniae TaxID=2933270 RepID=A0ABT0GLQ8_9GAMM|nr:cadherin domain-containing protein [Lysobacter sp. CAU 1642]MCK7594972.1 cadherin domain-containing protein [Lysobacter sp. CAU 1642]